MDVRDIAKCRIKSVHINEKREVLLRERGDVNGWNGPRFSGECFNSDPAVGRSLRRCYALTASPFHQLSPAVISAAGLHNAYNHALANFQSLSLGEEITVKASVSDEKILPIDVETCGADAQEYRENLPWWLVADFSEEYKEGTPLLMGTTLSLQDSGRVDSIILCAHFRMIVIKIWHLSDRCHHSEFLLDHRSDLTRFLYGRLQI